MRKLFSIFAICFAATVFANGGPVFEENNEKEENHLYTPFAAHESEKENPVLPELFGMRADREPTFEDKDKINLAASLNSWSRYQAIFGMEKISIRLPYHPSATQANSLSTVYAYDGPILYSCSGYYPPAENIRSSVWFDEILFSMTNYPYNLVSYVISQAADGDWILDYIAHDYVQNLIIKTRTIVTPLNGYTLQCVKPYGMSDNFDYFVDSFWIKCACA